MVPAVVASSPTKSFLQRKAGAPQCPAPIFVLDGTGKFCVCKDPETCPKTGATLSAEDAATYALAAHAAFKEGGHDGILKMGDPLGAPLSLAQNKAPQCPAPIFVLDGTG